HQVDMDTNLHHYERHDMSSKTKDFISSFENRMLRIYVKRRGGGGRGGGAVAAGARGRTSSDAIGKRPAFLPVLLALTLFLGVVLL
ncbi:hypothetical protein PanWU01x14_286030, partial [Parasponia andersonii]